MRRKIPCLWLLFLGLTAWASNAATYLVRADGTGDFPTIQEALAAAGSGDTILLANGTFTGPGNRNLDYLAKTLVVRSESGDPSTCVIDCQGAGRGFTFVSVQSPQAKLIGVTVTGGIGDGAGIYCEHSNPTIENCVLRNNGSPDRGGGIHCRLNSFPTVRDCVITDNQANSGAGLWCYDSGADVTNTIISNNTALAVGGGGVFMNVRAVVSLTGCEISGNTAPNTGGGIYCGGAFTMESDLTIVDCEISGNEGPFGGGLFINTSNVTVENTVFSGNLSPASDGGAVYCATSSPTFTRCTITGNHAENNGGAVGTYSANPTFNRSILWGNCADQLGDEVHLQDTSSGAVFLCSLVSTVGIEGPGDLFLDGNTIDEDPVFCAPEPCTMAPTIEGAYTLDVSSPAAAENSPVCGLIGALDVGCGVSSVGDLATSLPSDGIRVIPNPMEGSARVSIIAGQGTDSDYRIDLFDIGGRVVRSWHGGLTAGTTGEVTWDGTDGEGQRLPSGSYYFRARVADQLSDGQVVLLRR